MSWWLQPCRNIDCGFQEKALERQAQLTKPTGALGYLEELAVTLAGLQHTEQPNIDHVWISLFAGDHGVMQENISAYPQAVTRQMLQNFTTGGASISVIAKQHQAYLQVIDCGTVGDTYDYQGVQQYPIDAGTQNFTKTAAMSETQCIAAMTIGKSSVDQAAEQHSNLFIAGEMGIGNTCSASALACLLLDESAEILTGVGTGIDHAKLQHKKHVIQRAVELHKANVKSDPVKILAAVGGFEIAAMVGAYLRCAQVGIPILIDGFISSVAALIAVRIQPKARIWMLFGHQSAEYGHARILKELHAQPILQLNLRLGEGSGAGVALGVLKTACVLHNEMATFQQAAVTGEKQ
ncbi:nicotinate-nucleotide--dimethylbenzimidazole phosphoribosyltransferase [Acinetobacter sp. MB5]|uniref:nicotinate-nucleotide--dimethylbenzimidazole phosphoribosyltransferase n=1 Tax=Acinetobacter sp. MB5 TaxID=2069438 RepID=UPI000DCFEEDF|nr:nicotinate-nucleotide--dimethylbenzimidazole phosphoribosyltransferase [Acinetobacter sp. MB5]